jgi:hypothetical protein
MIYNRSHDARLESGSMTGVVTSTVVKHTTEVVCSDRSWAYDWSRVFRPESGLRPELRLLIGVVASDRSRAYDRSREIHAL